MSVAPPGGNGTMKRTGFCGHDWACAHDIARPSSKAASVFMILILQGQSENKTNGERDCGSDCGETLLPLVPVEELDRQDPQSATEMRGERDHDRPLARLHQWLLGPGEERIQLQRIAERPEMKRQEKRQRHAGDAMQVGEPAAHAKTASTARIPAHSREIPKRATKISLDAPRHFSHSPSTGRSPIGAWIAAAITNSE